MPSPDRNFANSAIFTQTASGTTPNSGDNSLFFKTDGNVYTKNSSAAESLLTNSNITGLTGATQLTNIVQITQAGYNAIGSPNANTLYIITA
jgi:hypothetical protein